jgi:hypothetical protein
VGLPVSCGSSVFGVGSCASHIVSSFQSPGGGVCVCSDTLGNTLRFYKGESVRVTGLARRVCSRMGEVHNWFTVAAGGRAPGHRGIGGVMRLWIRVIVLSASRLCRLPCIGIPCGSSDRFGHAGRRCELGYQRAERAQVMLGGDITRDSAVCYVTYSRCKARFKTPLDAAG